MPLRRYLIGAICTLARPDALYDISVRPDRQQWHRNASVLDLNPAGRIQTRKNRPALPPSHHSWRTGWRRTDDRLVCHESVAEEDEDRWVVQRPVQTSKSVERHGKAVRGASWFRPQADAPQHGDVDRTAWRLAAEIPLALGHVVLPPSTRRYVIFSPAYLIQTKQALEDIASELARRMSTPHHAKPTQVGPDGRGGRYDSQSFSTPSRPVPIRWRSRPSASEAPVHPDVPLGMTRKRHAKPWRATRGPENQKPR